MNVVIRPERPEDCRDVFAVNAAAFETDAEARLVDALRDGGFVEVSLVAEAGGKIVGHILFSTLAIETESRVVPALALAPMAVLPNWQRQGIGTRLATEGIEAARAMGHRIIVVLGHPEFYPRFGFSPALAAPLRSPFTGVAWMALELTPGALSGIAGQVRYAPPFGIDESAYGPITASPDS